MPNRNTRRSRITNPRITNSPITYPKSATMPRISMSLTQARLVSTRAGGNASSPMPPMPHPTYTQTLFLGSYRTLLSSPRYRPVLFLFFLSPTSKPLQIWWD